MNAVQIIHKHVMLRFCVILLAVLVTFISFSASFSYASSDYIYKSDDSHVAGSIVDGIKYLGILCIDELKDYVFNGSHLSVTNLGHVTRGNSSDSEFYLHYSKGLDDDEAYKEWISKYDYLSLPCASIYGWLVFPANVSYMYFHDLDSRFTCSLSSNVAMGTFKPISSALAFVAFSQPFTVPAGYYAYDLFTCSITYNDGSSGYHVGFGDYSFLASMDSNGGSSGGVVYADSTSKGDISGSHLSGAYSSGLYRIALYVALKPASDSVDFDASKTYRVGSVSPTISDSIKNIGKDTSFGLIDSSTVDDANYIYRIPYLDETTNKLILPDGSTVSVKYWTYDYNTRMYYCECSDGVIRSITYGSDTVNVKEGDVTNNYYYAALDGSNSGGSTTDPDNPDPSNPDKPSGDDDDDSGSIWDKVVDAIAGLFTAIGKVIGGLLESVINLFTGIVDGLTGCLDLFGSFGEFVAGFYTWMPEEWRTILAAAFTIFIGLAVVKLFRGS